MLSATPTWRLATEALPASARVWIVRQRWSDPVARLPAGAPLLAGGPLRRPSGREPALPRATLVSLAFHLALLTLLIAVVQERYIPPPPEPIAVTLLMEPAPIALPSPAVATPPAPVERQPPAPAPTVPPPPAPVPPPAPAQPPAVEPPPAATPAAPPPPVESAPPLPLPPPPAPPAPPLRAAPARPVPSREYARPAGPPTAGETEAPLAPRTPSASVTAPSSPPRPMVGLASNRPPAYPALALRRREEGRVILRVTVSATGSVLAVSVLRGSGHQSLDAAAVDAVRQWRFVPASRDGVAVEGVAEAPVDFHLAG